MLYCYIAIFCFVKNISSCQDCCLVEWSLVIASGYSFQTNGCDANYIFGHFLSYAHPVSISIKFFNSIPRCTTSHKFLLTMLSKMLQGQQNNSVRISKLLQMFGMKHLLALLPWLQFCCDVI